MKKFFVLFVAAISFCSTWAQKKTLTLEAATLNTPLYPVYRQMPNLMWQDNEHFTYIKEWSTLIQQNVKTGKIKELLQLKELNEILKKDDQNTVNSINLRAWISPTIARFDYKNIIFLLDIESKTIIFKNTLPNNADNITFHEASKQIAYTIDNNLFLSNAEGKVIALSNDTNPHIVNGSNNVHRQEFSIKKGIFFSPSGRSIAYYKKDETMVDDYPLVDVNHKIAKLRHIKYPMAGTKSEEVVVAIFNITTGKTIYIAPRGNKEDYSTKVVWDPSEKYIYIAELNRAQNHLQLQQYDATTGAFIKTVLEEKNDKWVEPQEDMVFLPNKKNQFLWFSEKDGYQHIYLYNTNGQQLKQVTSGAFVVTDLLGIDDKNEFIYVLTTKDSPLERHLYKYSLQNNKNYKLTQTAGTHQILLSPNKNHFIDIYSNYKTAKTINLVSNKNNKIKNLVTTDNPLEDYQIGTFEHGKIKAADGETDLYFKMVKPSHFDPSKKYPAIVYVYGGPHAQLVNNTFLGTGLFDYYLAEQGFIVFTIDNRGSHNRGFDFQSVIHRQNGQEEMKDQMKGVEYLSSLPFVDTSKIGVFGWSYGGFMTSSLITNYPSVFKVGVAGGPVIDWKFYEVMYGERYMDTPQENPEGYQKTSLLNSIKNLKGRLLVIHGDVDPVVVLQNSYMLLKKATDENVLVDYAIYPTHEHNVGGKDRINLNKKITQYFLDYLK